MEDRLENHKLKRELGILELFAIAAGAMISSGLFILPALAYAKSGPAVVFAYILAGIMYIPSIFAKAELATAMPKAGGVYFFIDRSMGAPVGTIGGIASWFSLTFKSAFALLGIGIFVTLIAPGITELQIKLIAIGFCLLFMVINIIGVKLTGKLQVILVLCLIVLLFYYVFQGSQFIEPQRYDPFMPYGLGSLFATAGLVFVSFGGLTKIACVAEEVKNPGRNIPLAMLFAFTVVMLLYSTVIFVTVGLVDAAELSGSLMPISLGASTFIGRWGTIIFTAAALLAFVTTGNAGILTASRDSLAMSRDKLLPASLQRVSARTQTPYISIIVTTVFMIIVIAFLDLENLVKTASTLKLLLFMFVNLSLIVMRESKIQSYRPVFRAPLYPWLQILGIGGYGFLISQMGKWPLITAGIFIFCTLLWYFIFTRGKLDRQGAFRHLIQRFRTRAPAQATLPDELREIVIERDTIIEDRFDQLIKECAIIDYEPPPPILECKADEIFQMVANTLSRRLEVDEESLFNRLMQREQQSSTVIAPGIAIPHTVIDGTDKFDIAILRCRKGIVLPGALEPVHTVFVLSASSDELNFYLRALAAVAQIAQDKEFDENWLKARNVEELRNILLLAERKRFG
jgi:APA family basic amino acid/polyamine antiporter